MKHLVVIFSLLFTSIIFAQTGIAKLNYGEVLKHKNIEVEFVEIINDSRCPKNVQCIRAGEAKVLVTIYKSGKFLEKKELVFYATGVTNETHNVLMSTDQLRLKGLTLFPYPTGPGSIADTDYFLEIQIN